MASVSESEVGLSRYDDDAFSSFVSGCVFSKLNRAISRRDKPLVDLARRYTKSLEPSLRGKASIHFAYLLNSLIQWARRNRRLSISALKTKGLVSVSRRYLRSVRMDLERAIILLSLPGPLSQPNLARFSRAVARTRAASA